MNLLQQRATVCADGTIVIHGFDYSNGSKPMRVWKRTKTHLVMKVPAGRCWNGNGQPWRSVPIRFCVFQILKAKDNELTLDPVLDFEQQRPDEEETTR